MPDQPQEQIDDTSNPEQNITLDYLIENPDEITINSLVEAGAVNTMTIFNNFFFIHTGVTEKYRNIAIEMIDKLRAKENIDPKKILKSENNRDFYQKGIDTKDVALNEMLDEGVISEKDLQKFTDYEFTYNEVVGAPLSKVVTEPDSEVFRAVNFMIDLYKRMRAKGLDHWDDLYM